jgi:hypothetical protein
MERNILLQLASWVCKIFSGFQIIGIVVATIVLVHWHIDRDFYNTVKVNTQGNVNLTSRTSETETKESGTIWIEKSGDTNAEKLSLADLTPVSVYIAYVQIIVVLSFMYLIFREFSSVVESVSALQTFRNENVEAFRKIGKYLLLVFLVSGFKFVATEPASAHVSMSFETTTLILMLVAYVLAEIFKEGNRLYEEEQLTV